MSWQMYDIIGKVMVLVGAGFGIRFAFTFLSTAWDRQR